MRLPFPPSPSIVPLSLPTILLLNPCHPLFLLYFFMFFLSIVLSVFLNSLLLFTLSRLFVFVQSSTAALPVISFLLMLHSAVRIIPLWAQSVLRPVLLDTRRVALHAAVRPALSHAPTRVGTKATIAKVSSRKGTVSCE